MEILLPRRIVKRLRRELSRAGAREIGGLLLGEHVGAEVFRVVELTFQRSGGSGADFIRQPEDHHKALEAFFERTDADYARFNYMGEWHSHPRFEARPSEVDNRTMETMTADPKAGVNFLVLLIARLGGYRRLEASATVFQKGVRPRPAQIRVEAAMDGGIKGWVRGVFARR